nr:hypothetical protein [Tanacetum cinerariifolium]
MRTQGIRFLKFDVPVQPRSENDPGRLVATPELLTSVSFFKTKILTSNTNELNAAYSVTSSTGHSFQAQGSSSYANELMFSFFANQSSTPQLDKEDLEKIDQDDLEEIDLKWNSGNMSRDARNAGYNERDNEEEATDFALMSFTSNPSSSSSSNSKNGKMTQKLGLCFGFTKKACFVCGSLIHLLKDCTFHEDRMAKKTVLPTNVGRRTGHYESRTVWKNVQRINHQNKFAPIVVFTRSGKIQVSAAKPKAAASTSVAKPINTAGPKQSVNFLRTRSTFHKSYSPIRRSFYNATAHSRRNLTERVNATGSKAVSVVKGNKVTAVKTSAGCVWRPKVKEIDQLSKDNRWIYTRVDYGHPHQALKNKGIVNSGCSRHMTGNKAYLADYQEIHDGGFVAFGSSRGKIIGKGKIRT